MVPKESWKYSTSKKKFQDVQQVDVTRNSSSFVTEVQKWLSGLENLVPSAKPRLYLQAPGIRNWQKEQGPGGSMLVGNKQNAEVQGF